MFLFMLSEIQFSPIKLSVTYFRQSSKVTHISSVSAAQTAPHVESFPITVAPCAGRAINTVS